MTFKRKEQIGDCTLYLGDCLDILPTIGTVDAVVTDPPYGIGADEAAAKNNGKWGWKKQRATQWDRKRPAREIFDLILASSKHQIIWGGNYFTDYLPPTMQWLIWDKAQRGFSLSDFEIAWSSKCEASRIFQYGRGNEKGFAPKSKEPQKFLSAHPTQKPVAVMRWCLSFVPDAETTLDPFMGSGTTGVACAKLGRKFIGIEIDKGYFDIACARIRKAYAQPDLFVPQPEKQIQEAML